MILCLGVMFCFLIAGLFKDFDIFKFSLILFMIVIVFFFVIKIQIKQEKCGFRKEQEYKKLSWILISLMSTSLVAGFLFILP